MAPKGLEGRAGSGSSEERSRFLLLGAGTGSLPALERLFEPGNTVIYIILWTESGSKSRWLDRNRTK